MNAGLKRICRSALWTLLGASLLVSGTAAAQGGDPDMREIFPYVMLVIDTSGSMEYLPSCTCDSPGCANCLPVCDATDVAERKNRWAVTLEALTGEFNNFECKQLARIDTLGATYDAGYFLPYTQPWLCSSGGVDGYCALDSGEAGLDQKANGILDIYASQVRFGLMTFDGWDTYKGFPPLVKATEFDEGLSEDRPGLWSYGKPKIVRYPGCDTEYAIDTGVRSSTAEEGSLVSLNSCSGTDQPSATCPEWCKSCPATQTSLNVDIQEALLSARPYGGTPISAALDDLYFHLNKDLTDDFGSCRNRYAILVTDGRPDADYRDLDCQCGQEGGSDPARCVPQSVTLPPGPIPAIYDPEMMHCPYPWPEDAARNLVRGKTENGTTEPAMIERLFVVGLSVSDSDVLARLNRIAEEGCTEEVEKCKTDEDGNFALFADSLSKLRTNLSKVIFDTIKPISRSVPAFGGSGTGAGTKQYQVSTGFDVATEVGAPWTGVIERTRYLCESGELKAQPITESEGDNFAVQLNKMAASERDLWTAVPRDRAPSWDTVITPVTPNGHLFKDVNSCSESGCTKERLDGINPLRFGTAFDDAKRDEIMAWMRGAANSPRDGKKLGDIYHSSPVIVGPPRYDTTDEGFNRFRQLPEIVSRPTMLYANTNDGILHAFHMEAHTDGTTPIEAGQEAWGFVPPMLLDRLNDNLSVHQFTMDGTPVVKNVFLSRTRGRPDSAVYRTVLITGMRSGGNGYIALDVTDPVNPTFLWQFTDPQMGMTFAQPAIGQAVYQVPDGSLFKTVEGAVAILPGGVGALGRITPNETGECDNGATNEAHGITPGTPFDTSHFATGSTMDVPLPHRSEVRCWQDKGRALYFVEVATGRLLKKIWKDSSGKRFFPSPLVSTPAIYPADVGSLMTEAFVVDADGVIWRIDMRAPDQKNDASPEGEGSDARADTGWTARPFHDIFHDRGPADGELTYEAPILSVDDEARLVVIVGTGDNNEFVKRNVRNRVVSLTEIVNADDQIAEADARHFKAALNWEMRMSTGGTAPYFVESELVTGTMGLFNRMLFFGSFIAVNPNAPACDLGKGRVHAVDYLARGPKNAAEPPSATSLGVLDPKTYGPLVIHVADSTTEADLGINVAPADAITNLMLMGLAINQRPPCYVTEPDDFSVFGQDLYAPTSVTDPAVYLVAQASGDSDLITKQIDGRLGNVQLQVNKPASMSQVVSWATSVE